MSDQTEPRQRPKRVAFHAHASDQPFEYPLRREYVEPDWRRLPGFADVTEEQWTSAQWQRAHTIKNLVELKRALGDLLTEDLYRDIERDQQELRVATTEFGEHGVARGSLAIAMNMHVRDVRQAITQALV